MPDGTTRIDPQLHSHVLVANRLKGRPAVDGIRRRPPGGGDEDLRDFDDGEGTSSSSAS
jgi:hypothetical protein